MKRALLSAALLSACTPDVEAYQPLAVQAARDLDVLFVLDDSSDHASYDAMAQQLDALTAGLASVDGQLPSLHVGVVTTDLGTSSTDDRAPLRPVVPGCFGYGKAGALQTFGAGVSAAYLEDLRAPDGTRTRNYASGDLRAELSALTNPTLTGGCEFEQPLEAMRKALDLATNPGFLRAGSLLAVVFVTNEDDCSLKTGALLEPLDTTLGPLTSYRCTREGVICDGDDPDRMGEQQHCRPREDSRFIVPVAEYTAFLHQLRPAGDVVVSAVAGPRTPFVQWDFGGQRVLKESCAGPQGTAVPPVRIGALVDAFGGAIADSCTQAAAYDTLAAPIAARQRSCFSALRMAEVDACTVLEVGADTETELDRCADGDTGPCWYAYQDAALCPDGDHLGIAIRRGATAAPARARLEARCFVD